jgi:2-polyprenyl-3-methyl-5-hydroxy-6-metoxy-1,4-benzoquinol methylase
MSRQSPENLIRECYSTWGSRYYADYYENSGAYPPVHTAIVRELLENIRAKTLLDAGCGPASMLRDLNQSNLQRFGFDLTPEMLTEGRRVLSAQGVPEDHLWQGSVLDPRAFSSGPITAPERYDAAICFGVLPHVPAESDLSVLSNLTSAVRPGGMVACEARNELFSLFTLNRYSRDFFRRRLIEESKLLALAGDDAGKRSLTLALERLDVQFRMDLPPMRKGYENEPGYDEVLSRTHNPFELRDLAVKAGLRDVEVLFYHYHALPPMLESVVPAIFRRVSLAMEDPRDWRGHFMASAFILVGYRL